MSRHACSGTARSSASSARLVRTPRTTFSGSLPQPWAKGTARARGSAESSCASLHARPRPASSATNDDGPDRRGWRVPGPAIDPVPEECRGEPNSDPMARAPSELRPQLDATLTPRHAAPASRVAIVRSGAGCGCQSRIREISSGRDLRQVVPV